MAEDRLESQFLLALAALGVAFAEALLQVQPALEGPLKTAVVKWANEMKDRGKGWELAADSLAALDRALHDQSLFPKDAP
jgi:hypothetical protein